MINTIFIEKDISYGRKLISGLVLRNNEFRLCGIANNEKELLFLIENIEIDIIIIDMPIDKCDQFMQLIEEKKKQASVILILDKNVEINNTYIDFFMNRKIDYNIKSDDVYKDANEINSMIISKLHSYNENVDDVSIEKKIMLKIEEQLTYLGYNLKHLGAKYIAETVYILFNAKDYCDENLERNIYPIVAKKFGKTVNNIKTNIKNATDMMYYECEEEKLMKYLGCSTFSNPKPKEVILTVLKKIM